MGRGSPVSLDAPPLRFTIILKQAGRVTQRKSDYSERRAEKYPTLLPSFRGVETRWTVMWLLTPRLSRAVMVNVRPAAGTATADAASTFPAPLILKLGSAEVKKADFLRHSETSTGRGVEGGGGVNNSLTRLKAHG